MNEQRPLFMMEQDPGRRPDTLIDYSDLPVSRPRADQNGWWLESSPGVWWGPFPTAGCDRHPLEPRPAGEVVARFENGLEVERAHP